MSNLNLLFAAILIVGASQSFAKGDGYNKTEQFYEAFRERQEQVHGKESEKTKPTADKHVDASADKAKPREDKPRQ